MLSNDIQLLSVERACKYLDVSKTTLYRLMAEGELPYVKFIRGRRIKVADLDRLVGVHYFNATEGEHVTNK